MNPNYISKAASLKKKQTQKKLVIFYLKNTGKFSDATVMLIKRCLYYKNMKRFCQILNKYSNTFYRQRSKGGQLEREIMNLQKFRFEGFGAIKNPKGEKDIKDEYIRKQKSYDQKCFFSMYGKQLLSRNF